MIRIIDLTLKRPLSNWWTFIPFIVRIWMKILNADTCMEKYTDVITLRIFMQIFLRTRPKRWNPK
jgi:hypothetical protein